MHQVFRNDEHKKIWAVTRSVLETDNHKHKRFGAKSRSHWSLFEQLIAAFGFFLKIVGLYQKGYRNAQEIVTNKLDIPSEILPEAFDGYRILHLTDLHLDSEDRIENILCDKIKNVKCDLCVLTGDYRERTYGSFQQMIQPMEKIARSVASKDGILAVLGNHDSYLMVEHLEAMGIKVLSNETQTIHRGNQKIKVTGTDDPNYYYTDQAITALEDGGNGFKVALVHTPELYDVAAENGYNLYLCGHTHGGQICLPGGIPVVTHLYYGREFHRGLWRHGEMHGYTNQGCGTVALPVRFNSESEIALITLRKSRS